MATDVRKMVEGRDCQYTGNFFGDVCCFDFTCISATSFIWSKSQGTRSTTAYGQFCKCSRIGELFMTEMVRS